MTLAINNKTYVGCSNLIMEQLDTNIVYAWPKPNTFVLSTGIEQKVQNTRSEQGRMVRARTYVSGEMPELSISYAYVQPEMISFSVGNKLATGTFATRLPKLIHVTKASYPAAAVGYLGKGVTADPGLAANSPPESKARASYMKNGVSTELTLVSFSGFSPTSVTSFAVGADFALKFSDDLVTAQVVVAVTVPYTATGKGLSDLLVGDHKISACLIDTENQVTFFEAFSATPNLGGQNVDFGAENMEIKMFLNNPPGACKAFQIIATDYKVGCI